MLRNINLGLIVGLIGYVIIFVIMLIFGLINFAWAWRKGSIGWHEVQGIELANGKYLIFM